MSAFYAQLAGLVIIALALLLLGIISALVFGRDTDAVETFTVRPEWPLRPYWWLDVRVPLAPPTRPQRPQLALHGGAS